MGSENTVSHLGEEDDPLVTLRAVSLAEDKCGAAVKNVIDLVRNLNTDPYDEDEVCKHLFCFFLQYDVSTRKWNRVALF